MKIIPLKLAEQFCRDHNFQSISLKQLRDMAIEAKGESGEEICYKAGYGQAINDFTEFVQRSRP